jgi:hypothetical protein
MTSSKKGSELFLKKVPRERKNGIRIAFLCVYDVSRQVTAGNRRSNKW